MATMMRMAASSSGEVTAPLLLLILLINVYVSSQAKRAPTRIIGQVLDTEEFYPELQPGIYNLKRGSLCSIIGGGGDGMVQTWTFKLMPKAKCFIHVKCPCGKLKLKKGTCLRALGGDRKGECVGTRFKSRQLIISAPEDSDDFICRVFCIRPGDTLDMPRTDCGLGYDGTEEPPTYTVTVTAKPTTKPTVATTKPTVATTKPTVATTATTKATTTTPKPAG